MAFTNIILLDNIDRGNFLSKLGHVVKLGTPPGITLMKEQSVLNVRNYPPEQHKLATDRAHASTIKMFVEE